ncbi:uncharacterized protein [Solanum lycopersicum]|uniref:uncharacterized protein n=1 Tax=Solanum lycopersicum TaxID=4081 RepID=UPI003748FCF4
MKDFLIYGKKWKLSPWYIGPYRISKRVGNVAYELELTPEFDVSYLYVKKCMGHPSVIISTKNIGFKYSPSYEEIPVKILDHGVRKLRTKDVASVKVLWKNQFIDTW